jgi:phenylpyruvate tautomerase PptA (4-oxalocrotonate tautomerase family)
MPIFHVDLHDTEGPREGLARALADDLGRLLETRPGHTWVRLSRCDPRWYAENDVPDAPRWAFVRVILRALPPEDELATRATRITEIVARHTGRPVEDVHVIFEPPAAGRIAFGGELVRKG